MKRNYVKGGIGKASSQIRERLQITQTELGDRVGCSFATVSRWERHPEELMVVRKKVAEKFLRLYNTHFRKSRAKVKLVSVEIDETELINRMQTV